MKRFIIMFAVLLVLLHISASGMKEEVSVPEKKADEVSVIRIWTLDRHDAAFWLERIAEYNRSNTHGIQVSYEIYTDDYWSAVDMAFRAGKAPDILRYDPAMDKYLFQDRFVDLLPFMTEEEKEFTHEGWYDGINYIDGKLYCIFTGSGFARLFYNQTLFDEMGLVPPRTLEELIDAARIITETRSKDGIYGFACNLGNAKNGLKRSLEPMVELGDGIRFGYDFGRGVYDFSPYIPYLEAWKELMKYAIPGCNSLGIDLLRRQFSAGKIGMYMSYAQVEPGVYDFQFPMADGQSFGCVDLPVIDGIRNGLQGGGGTPAYYINRDSEHLEDAWTVYSELFLDYDNLVERFESNLGISNLSAVIDNSELSEKYRTYPALLLDRTYDTVYPKTPEEKYPVEFIIQGMDMFEVFSGIINGKIDVHEGVADLTERYNEVNERLIESGYERIVNPDFARDNH